MRSYERNSAHMPSLPCSIDSSLLNSSQTFWGRQPVLEDKQFCSRIGCQRDLQMGTGRACSLPDEVDS